MCVSCPLVINLFIGSVMNTRYGWLVKLLSVINLGWNSQSTAKTDVTCSKITTGDKRFDNDYDLNIAPARQPECIYMFKAFYWLSKKGSVLKLSVCMWTQVVYGSVRFYYFSERAEILKFHEDSLQSVLSLSPSLS